MNRHDQAFNELKEKINEMAPEMGYKVRYHTGTLGEPLKIEIDGVPVRALKVIKNNQEILVAKLGRHIYAFANGQRWDITSNFMFFKVRRYLALEERIKMKLRKEDPVLGALEMVFNKQLRDGLDINEIIDIFTTCEPQSYELKNIRI